MVSHPRLLKKAEQLRRAGVEFAFEPGKIVCRGYADLGYEEFLLLTPTRLLSLHTGQTSELTSDHQSFFSRVPELDEVVARLDEKGWDIVSLVHRDRRTWCLTLKKLELEATSFEGNFLHEVFMDACLHLLGEEQADAPERALISSKTETSHV